MAAGLGQGSRVRKLKPVTDIGVLFWKAVRLLE